MNQDLKFTDDFKARISKAKTILAVRFVEGHPVEYISSDMRHDGSVSQIVLKRDEILGDWELKNRK
jgi:hypothetical protein